MVERKKREEIIKDKKTDKYLHWEEPLEQQHKYPLQCDKNSMWTVISQNNSVISNRKSVRKGKQVYELHTRGEKLVGT